MKPFDFIWSDSYVLVLGQVPKQRGVSHRRPQKSASNWCTSSTSSKLAAVLEPFGKDFQGDRRCQEISGVSFDRSHCHRVPVPTNPHLEIGLCRYILQPKSFILLLPEHYGKQSFGIGPNSGSWRCSNPARLAQPVARQEMGRVLRPLQEKQPEVIHSNSLGYPMCWNVENMNLMKWTKYPVKICWHLSCGKHFNFLFHQCAVTNMLSLTVWWKCRCLIIAVDRHLC